MAQSTIEPAAEPTRSSRSKRATAALTGEHPQQRVLWRAVVRTGGTFGAGRERDRVEWHLVGCEVPHAEGSHCTEGEHLIETSGHPDGHCVVNGRCGRCGQTARQATLARKAA
jgi:hypothetical protein